jgi:hypothetical protein
MYDGSTTGLADGLDRDPALVRQPGPDQGGAVGQVQVGEARVGAADHALGQDRAALVGDLDERRRQVRVLAGQRLVDRGRREDHGRRQLARAGQPHRVVAEALDLAQDQVEADVELARGVVAQPAVEAAQHHADRDPGRHHDRQDGGHRQRDRELVAQAQAQAQQRPAPPADRAARHVRAACGRRRGRRRCWSD